MIETIDATCLTEGKVVQQCSLCDDETVEVLPILEHEWQDANCVTPKTCVLCSTTEGNVAGHIWVDATCTTPKTCSICALTEGEVLSQSNTHTWEKATCTQPKTCSVCNAVEGTTIPHTLGNWEIVEEAVGDIEDGLDGEALALASINKDGCKLNVMSTNFKTERNMWINDQFSAWDGSHTVLKSLM